MQRAQLGLLAPHPPPWQNAASAQRLGGSVNTVKRWRPRWQTTDALHAAPRAGTRRPVTPLQRAPGVAVACGAPRQYGKPWRRGSGEQLAPVAVEQGFVAPRAPRTIRRWRPEDTLTPWRSPSWPPSPDPQCGANATPGLDLYAQAPSLHAQGALTLCAEEKTSIPARPRVTATTAAAPGAVLQGAERYKGLGALQLFWAWGGPAG